MNRNDESAWLEHLDELREVPQLAPYIAVIDTWFANQNRPQKVWENGRRVERPRSPTRPPVTEWASMLWGAALHEAGRDPALALLEANCAPPPNSCSRLAGFLRGSGKGAKPAAALMLRPGRYAFAVTCKDWLEQRREAGGKVPAALQGLPEVGRYLARESRALNAAAAELATAAAPPDFVAALRHTRVIQLDQPAFSERTCRQAKDELHKIFKWREKIRLLEEQGIKLPEVLREELREELRKRLAGEYNEWLGPMKEVSARWLGNFTD